MLTNHQHYLLVYTATIIGTSLKSQRNKKTLTQMKKIMIYILKILFE